MCVFGYFIVDVYGVVGFEIWDFFVECGDLFGFQLGDQVYCFYFFVCLWQFCDWFDVFESCWFLVGFICVSFLVDFYMFVIDWGGVFWLVFWLCCVVNW